MIDWTDGYVADTAYTFGYYPELNPLRRQLAFLNAGLASPATGTACELGFGQGVGVNIHAAASDSQWFGTDFNPAHASFAQELAAISGSGAQLFDQSFAEFCGRSDLPEFDYIGLHGIWSWISNENRTVIVDFVRRKLRPGGLLYIGYNTQPGWATMVPVRDLLCEHSKVMQLPGKEIVTRIDGALRFAERLFAIAPKYVQTCPQLVGRLEAIKTQDRNYVAHEYFNRDWLPMSFAHMIEWLKPAKLNFACSANYLDHVNGINFTAEQQAFLHEIPDAMFRETVRDFIVNQLFRKDYRVRGARKLNPMEQAEAFRRQRIMLVQARADVSLKVAGALGQVTLQEQVYGPILDMLADHQPKTLGQIEQVVKNKGVVFAQIREAVLLLTAVGSLALTQEDAPIAAARQHTDRLNAFLRDWARGSNDANYLASPVIGGGVGVNRFQQLFLLANNQGKKHPAEWAQFVWQLLVAQRQKISKEGKTLETEQENLAELTLLAQTFADKQLPILTALGIS